MIIFFAAVESPPSSSIQTLIFSFLEDRVDHSDSPLTDMTVLFGGAGRLAKFLEYFDRWLEKEEIQTFWESLAWVKNKL